MPTTTEADGFKGPDEFFGIGPAGEIFHHPRHQDSFRSSGMRQDLTEILGSHAMMAESGNDCRFAKHREDLRELFSFESLYGIAANLLTIMKPAEIACAGDVFSRNLTP